MTPSRGDKKYTGTYVGDRHVLMFHVKRSKSMHNAYGKLGFHKDTELDLHIQSKNHSFTRAAEPAFGAITLPVALWPKHERKLRNKHQTHNIL